jgi:hypothetical protein
MLPTMTEMTVMLLLLAVQDVRWPQNWAGSFSAGTLSKREHEHTALLLGLVKSLNGKPTYDVTMPRSRKRVQSPDASVRCVLSKRLTREPIDPKDPIELIDLVLETYGEQTIGLFDHFHAAQK